MINWVGTGTDETNGERKGGRKETWIRGQQPRLLTIYINV